jgi:zinc/manganese transport system substrate-binding protein
MAPTAFERGMSMHRSLFIYALLFMATSFSEPADAALNVFTCEPEWSALAEELGGDHLKAVSATHGLQDPHYIEARPSLISRVRKADLVVCTGAQLEIAWLPLLLGKANNPSVRPGTDGFLEASSFVPRLDVADSADRSQGDVHLQGNPHIQINPHNISLVAKALSTRLAALDPANAVDYSSRLQDFLQRWEAAIERWEVEAEPLRGKTLVAHHRSFVYLEDWLGLVELDTLEPLPGVPPTSSHLTELLNLLGSDGSGADFIIRESYQSAKPADWLSKRTGITAVMLPMTIDGSPGATDLFSFFDDILQRLLGAMP